MEANKVYQDIVILLYNVLHNEKLRYELYKDEKFRELYITLVNDLLTLEREQKITYKDKQWANVFGKAIVITSQAKQRFEKQDGKTVAKIYEDYSKMIGYSMNAFDMNRDVLTAITIDFSEDDVLYDARLTDDVIKKYDTIAKEQEKEKAAQENPEVFVNENKKKKNDSTSENTQGNYGGFNNGQNGFYGQPNGQSFTDFAQNMPKPPMSDPRFYPFDRKPKWMVWAKYVLGVVVIVTAILLIIASAYANSKTFSFNTFKYPTGGDIGNWTLVEAITNQDKNPHQLKDIGNTFNLAMSNNTTFMSVIIYIFYAIPAIYIAYNCFSKPKSLAQKYRISYWPIIFMVIFFALSIIDTYQFASIGQIKGNIQSSVKGWVNGYEQNTFDTWFNSLSNKLDIKATTILMDVAIGFLGASIIFGVVLVVLNPKMDRNKFQKAQAEYQKAVMSAMQGIPYTMDPSLFEDDNDVIIKNKTKFGLWIEKVINKMKFWKHSNKNRPNNND